LTDRRLPFSPPTPRTPSWWGAEDGERVVVGRGKEGSGVSGPHRAAAGWKKRLGRVGGKMKFSNKWW
jgi:hypothetical protein